MDESTEENGAVAPSDARLRQLADLRAGNEARVAELGQAAQLVNTTRLRLDTLIALVLEEDDRLTFEIEYERRAATRLDQVRQDVKEAQERARQAQNRAALLAGVRPTNGHRP